ncbi:Zinc finger CCHC-type, partial [Trinorchestia longiramus]
LGFAGTRCPSHIYVGFTRYAVFPFNAPPQCCYRCQRLGHVAVNCNSPLRCLVCSGPHTKDECTAEPGQEKCANCHQTHIASSKECPAIRNAAAIQKLQHSGVSFEAAKHKVMKTQTELATKASFMKKQNLTVPTVSLNIMGSQHSIQENQQENQNDLTIQEVMVDIHQSGGSYLWSEAEALPSTASSSPLYSSVVHGLVDLPSTSEHFQLSGVQERTPSMNITQSAKKPSPQMTTATECAEILSKSVASLGKKLEHQMKEMGREMGSRSFCTSRDPIQNTGRRPLDYGGCFPKQKSPKQARKVEKIRQTQKLSYRDAARQVLDAGGTSLVQPHSDQTLNISMVTQSGGKDQYSSKAQPTKLVSVGTQTGDELISPTSPNITVTQLVELLARTLTAFTR